MSKSKMNYFRPWPKPKPKAVSRTGSDLDREVAEFVAENKREPLPGQKPFKFDKPKETT